jgi:hypothetical protein
VRRIALTRHIESTERREYAVALNCTITKTSENTIPVKAITPGATSG